LAALQAGKRQSAAVGLSAIGLPFTGAKQSSADSRSIVAHCRYRTCAATPSLAAARTCGRRNAALASSNGRKAACHDRPIVAAAHWCYSHSGRSVFRIRLTASVATLHPRRRSRTRTGGPLRVELELSGRRRARWGRLPRPRLPRARLRREWRQPLAILWRALLALVVLAAVAYFVVFGFVRSLPDAAVVVVPRAVAVPGRLAAIAWPSRGEAAVGVEGVGLLAAHGAGNPTPIASVAKVMTAVIVVHDHPLTTSASGPQITVTSSDVAVYRADQASAQSVVPVRAGERLTERQALEGLLLPSGNNIATLLARWDAGRQAAFVARMNAQARGLGLGHTRYVDAAGFQPGTVSTAADQVRLAIGALENPTLRQIVGMAQTTLPVAGRRYNLDALLGRDGIIGVKTGSSSRAGGCFVFAANERVGGRTVTVVGAVLHQLATSKQPSTIGPAFQASMALLMSLRSALSNYEVVRRGATLVTVKVPWSEPIAGQTIKSTTLIGWPDLPIHTAISPVPKLAAPLTAGQRIAIATVTAGEQRLLIPLVAARALPNASLGWRVEHP